MAYDYIHEVLKDNSIENPARSILVRFHHKPFRPEGSDVTFPGRNILVEVLSETERGALEIARCHHRLHGESFEVERRPWRRSLGREVVIEERRVTPKPPKGAPARRASDLAFGF